MKRIDLAFLHGGGQGSWVWKETIAALRAQNDGVFGRILALDIPGCGAKRGQPTEQLARQDVLRELIADLERAEMKNIVLAGHSLAGNVMPALAEQRPNLFHRLVYISCLIPLQGQTVVQLMGGGLHGSKPDEVGWPVDPRTTSTHDRYELMFCSDMSESQKTAFFANMGQDEWPRQFFSTTDFTFGNPGAVPATYVVCLEDRSLPAVWQETFAARFAAKRLVRIDAGHQVMITRPHALAEVLRQEAGLG